MIGEKRMYKFLNTCLKTKNEWTGYDFFKKNALKSDVYEKEWDAYEKDFILSENAVYLVK